MLFLRIACNLLEEEQGMSFELSTILKKITPNGPYTLHLNLVLAWTLNIACIALVSALHINQPWNCNNSFMVFPTRNICSLVVMIVICQFLFQHGLVWNVALLGRQQKEVQPCLNHILPRREYFLAWQHAETGPCSRAGCQPISDCRQWRGWDNTVSSDAKSEEKL